jgi:hypothetical protein
MVLQPRCYCCSEIIHVNKRKIVFSSKCIGPATQTRANNRKIPYGVSHKDGNRYLIIRSKTTRIFPSLRVHAYSGPGSSAARQAKRNKPLYRELAPVYNYNWCDIELVTASQPRLRAAKGPVAQFRIRRYIRHPATCITIEGTIRILRQPKRSSHPTCTPD